VCDGVCVTVCVQVSECRRTCYGRGEGLGRRRREDGRGRQGKKMEGGEDRGEDRKGRGRGEGGTAYLYPQFSISSGKT